MKLSFKSTFSFVLFVAVQTFSQSYEVVDLGTLGGAHSQAYAINNNGIIAGWATGPSSGNPVLWMGDSIFQVIDNPPGYAGKAVAINHLGQVAVTGEGNPQSYKAFLWENNTYTDLGVLPSRNESIAEDIDDMGRVVGRSFSFGAGNGAGFIWEAGVMTDLGTLGGATDAYGINNMGQVVGWSQENIGGTLSPRAFIWENNVMTALGPLPNEDFSQAFDLNDSGHVVGSSWHSSPPQFFSADQSTLWQNEGSEIIDLGLTPGPPECIQNFPFWTKNIARAINNYGQVVGHAQCVASGAAKAAFLWDNGNMYNLNDLVPPGTGWDLLRANDINDEGKIVGFGINPAGELHAFLLIPAVVPVELTSFSAEVNKQDVILNWVTASETNNIGFEIQKRSDGSFNTLKFIEGKGTTTENQNYSFTDENLEAGLYYYRLKQIDYDGNYEYSEEISVDVLNVSSFVLNQNYPNPFNPTTNINYYIPGPSFVLLKIYDTLGNEVALLVSEKKNAGSYETEFNATFLPSGIYFYRLKAGSFVETKKMVLIK